ncbi:unnamed protein product [Discosporangium mesarthrocarpum]
MIGSAFTFQWSGMWTLFWLCMFMLTFSMGLGPVTFVVASEIFPMAVRGKAMALVVFVNRFMSGVIALCYESIVRIISAGFSFYLFATLSIFSVFFYWYLVPETRGKPLDEISNELVNFQPPQCSCGPWKSGPGAGSRDRGPRHHQLHTDDDQT